MKFSCIVSSSQAAKTISQLDDVDIADFLNHLARRIFQDTASEDEYKTRVETIRYALNKYGNDFTDELRQRDE